MKERITHQPGTSGEIADLSFEVLNLIEVAGPMQWALRHASMAAKRDGIAQSFPELSEVPDSTILPTVVVAGGTADVLLKGHPCVAGVIENLFPV